jgi:hypothetical protein
MSNETFYLLAKPTSIRDGCYADLLARFAQAVSFCEKISAGAWHAPGRTLALASLGGDSA